METHQIADEIKDLKACLNDLITVLALPAIWSIHEPSQIVSTLLEALVGMLRLDFAYVRLGDSFGRGGPIEMVRVIQPQPLALRPQEIGHALAPWLRDGLHASPIVVPNPIGEGEISISAFRLGVQDELGILVAGSRRADFATEVERLVLRVTANQAAIALQEARLLSEQRRVAEELDERVAQRTQDLAAANEELKKEIAERKRVEEKLRQDEKELRRITDAIPQAIGVLAPDGTALHANQVVLDYTGLTVEDLKTDDFRKRLFHPDDLERVRETRRHALEYGDPFELELRVRRKDGQYRWFLFRHNPLRDDEGRIIRWYATGIDIEERKQAEESIRNENMALREEIDGASMFEEIVGSSEALRKVLRQVAKVAPVDSTVLILGETGTGKELIARAIHKRSNRSSRAFIRVNCAAIPSSLIASELFGHEKGAFTGALQRRLGRFESANGGTIFLDEIGELPAETQIALLRVLQEREIERVGGSQPIPVDVRVVAATNRDLNAAVSAGSFRQDLFYRLNVFPVQLPSLRERVDDIPLLVEYLIERYAKKAGKKIRQIRKQTLEVFQAYDWPGNIRELQNVIERAVVLCDGETFSVDETWLKRERDRQTGPAVPLAASIAEREKEMIEAALAQSHGRVSGSTGAAVRLGLPRQTLESKIKSLGIDKRRFANRTI
ncbi:MAG: sigma 54-interacting transcriptional regulator [Nitrospiraceae bacterium]